jgi:hypothetical protein
MTACMQPRCTGMIVDDYCDICGSPAGAAPFVPAAASAASPAPTDEPGPTAVRREPGFFPEPKSGSLMTACTQPGCIGVIVDDYCDICGSPAGAAPFVPAAASAASPAPTDEPGPTAVPAPTPAPGPIDEEIPTQRIPPVIDVEGSREVEATLRRLIEPAAADLQEADTAEGEPAAADLEQADTAPAGPQHDDTVKRPAVPAVLSGGQHQHPQVPEQPVGPEPVQTPAEKRRFGSLALAATALAVLLIGALLFAASRDRGVTAQSVPTVTATPTATATKPTSEPSDESTGTKGEKSTIQLEDLPASARPFEAVHIQGTYRGGSGTFLRVQRWEGGKWLDFPIPTMTDQSGQFITQAEFAQPGRYRLRVVDPGSGVTSKPFVVVIKG